MKGRPPDAGARTLPGPVRWHFKQYQILERATPMGRRYEVRSPNKELVGWCRIKKADEVITIWADADESQALVVMRSKVVPQYSTSFEIVDGPSKKRIGELRKKVYRPLGTWEWFLYNGDGEPVGMVTESSQPTPLRNLLPFPRPAGKTYQLHWGQSIAGTLTSQRLLLGGEQTQLDLVLDKKDEVDRRLALAVAVLIREDQRNGSGAAA